MAHNWPINTTSKMHKNKAWIAKQEEDKEVFHGWSEDDGRQVVKNRRRIEFKEDLDKNGNTFGMLPYTTALKRELVQQTGQIQLLQVKMNPSLITHLKSVLGAEAEVKLPSEEVEACSTTNGVAAATGNDAYL